MRAQIGCPRHMRVSVLAMMMDTTEWRLIKIHDSSFIVFETDIFSS
jgi:hypothetical protein